jgi:uncharacterized membrane protein YhaH (DUF805 family)
MKLTLTPQLLGFVVGTRAILAFGAGLLLADRIPQARRKSIALAMIGFGVATTFPAARAVLARRSHDADASRPAPAM